MATINRKFFKNSIMVIMLLGLATFVYYCKNVKTESDYYNPQTLATHDNGEHFVGSKTCMECHADIYNTHLETAHFNSGSMADSSNIKGSFKEGSNILDLKSVEFVMRSDGEYFYQHTRIKNRSTEIPPSKFDIVIGSGVRGQSYLTWDKDDLYQLQASYYTPTDSWVNSPGYPTYYDEPRPIRDACLKCHITYAKTVETSPNGNRFDRSQMIYGIDCERCHGPSAKHVVYHRENPEAIESKFTLKIEDLSRQQRLDLCAQCHSGPRNIVLKGNSFSYATGEDLKQYTKNVDNESSERKLDVHGNQYGLLTRSECFKQTATMDCSTCHDPHRKERGNTAYFNGKCIGCHNDGAKMCSNKAHGSDIMTSNCITCHMPTTPSQAMMVQLTKDSLETSFNIRTHLIGIYEQELWRD
ncbi:hypothetical protein DHD05_03195 [Arenibacter sp. N53]|uniref:multiheme c-type cytochrome n=1 Tax=Arenibacter TaxID=178469 RepID=UPI000CD40F52|nr:MULTISPECIES: multiheme c-type cytochrome [Arenibacter]MCM4150586.1 hypothetical protein [Arenibacter sp. N53]